MIHIILVFSALLGTQFNIDAGISWADVFCAVLGIEALYKFYTKSWRLDIVSKYTLGYTIILFISSLVNQTIAQTQFLNYFRIFISGLIIYIVVNNTLKQNKSFKAFSIAAIIYSLIFIFMSRSNLQNSMITAENFASLDFSYGRNNWGFSNLLIIIFLTFIITKVRISKPLKILAFLLFPFLIFNVYFSASRFSLLSLIFFAIFVRVWINKPLSFKEFALIIGIILVFPIVSSYILEGFGSNFIEQSRLIFENKIDRTVDETMTGRLMALNLLPIVDVFSKKGFEYFILGDGISVTHGILSHTYIATGIMGLLYFVYYNCLLSIHFFKIRGVGYFVTFLILIMLANDIMTNARFIIGINNMLFMMIMAFLNNIIKYGGNSRISFSN